MGTTGKRLLTLLCVMLAACASVFAQGTAQINGTVKDATGAAVPGADIKATQTATGAVRTATSGADGNYTLANVPIGPYMVEVTKQGFSKIVQTGIVLQVDSNPTIDIAMKVGTVNEEVTVNADAALVETHSTGVGTVVDNQRVVEMPLNGRNATELVFLAGMATIGGSNGGFLNSVRNYPTVIISVAGGVANQQQYTLDGTNHNDAYNGLNLPLPFPDALQEFKVESSALPAQYGMHSSAAVNAVTKSGTNDYHGDAFYFLRNGDLNARDFFAPTRDTLKRNQFGGVFGGPVLPRWKNKLFFFAGYQGTILKSDGSQNIAYVPTAAEQAGNFQTAASTTCNAKPITLSPTYGFVNNILPASLISPFAQKVDAFLPQSTDPCGKVNYALLSNSNENSGVMRVDYQRNDKNTMWWRYYETNLDIPSTFVPGNALTLNSNFQHDRVYSANFGQTYLLSASLVNSFHFGENRSAIPKIVDNFATWPQLGVNAPYNPAPAPRISVTGNGFGIGSGNSIINHDMTGPNTNLADDVSWVKGDHQFGFGVNWLRIDINYESGINATGLPTFNGTASGLPMADYMIGEAATWTQGNISYFYNRQNYIGAYAQDSWKVKPNFTINYGVRWEPFFPIRSKEGLFEEFVPQNFAQGVVSTVHVNAPAGLIFPGDSQWQSGNSIAKSRWNEFVPRVGFVWDPKGDGKTSIRTAFGSYTDRSGLYALSSFGQDAPVGNAVTVNGPLNITNPWATYPGGNPLPILLSKNENFPTGAAYITYPNNWKPLWVNQWNFSVQHQISNDWLVTANYVGNNTFHLVTEDQLNPGQFLGTGPCTLNVVNPAGTVVPTNYAVCSTTANLNQRRPLYLANPTVGQYYGIISQGSPSGTGSYNALFLQTQKRLSHGTTLLANYTWSHCISDLWNGQPGNNGVSSVTPNDRRADRGNCSPNLVSSDQRQVFNLSVVATTPKFSNKIMTALLSDWQVSPIMKIKSAQYFTVLAGTDVALNGETGAERPNLVNPGGIYASNQSANSWINASAFANASPGSLGNLGIGNLKGPSVFQLDMALVRAFKIREKQTFQLRAEAFNLPNHTNLSTPVATLTSGAFGQIQSDISGTSGLIAGDYRVIQFALKYLF